jgi:ATP-binding cassette subfamily C protein
MKPACARQKCSILCFEALHHLNGDNPERMSLVVKRPQSQSDGSVIVRPLSLLIRAMARAGGWRLGFIIALVTMLPVMEAAGAALLLPALSAAGMNSGGAGAAGYYTRAIERAFAAAHLHPGFAALLAGIGVAMAARGAMDRARDVAAWTVLFRLQDSLRRRLYRAIADSGWLFVTRARSSDFVHALTAELDRANWAASALIWLLSEAVTGALYLTIAFAFSARVTLITLACGAALALLLRAKARRIGEIGRELADHAGVLHAAASEHLGSLKTAKMYGAEARNYELFSRVSGRIAEANIRSMREQSAAALWFELGGWALLLPILYGAVRVLTVAPADLLILMAVFWRLMPRFQAAHSHYRNLAGFMPSFANVIAMENRCIAAAEPASDGDEAPEPRHEIRLEHVSFAYGDSRRPAICDLNLRIPARRITAIVGPSGAGKSTTADILMGLIAPDGGRLTIDGAPLENKSLRAWRESIGYVANDTPLFHLSIRDNLLWARPDASEDELWRALRFAAAETFVRELPEGIDTIAGERGLRLSQGERQRIALARAILRRPSILVLDEATNSLDHENEARVLGAIEALRGEITVLIIAHRLSAIRWADLIHVIEDGVVAESGEWRELNARREGRFRALCDAHRLVA